MDNLKTKINTHYSSIAQKALNNGSDTFPVLSCGSVKTIENLNPGETILDLGSGPGREVLLAAQKVGPTGKAYGLDISLDMLKLANHNREKLNITNATFLQGEMEDIPLPDNSVDVVISNCVINLSLDKTRTISEISRVLKPKGRIQITDKVTLNPLPQQARKDPELWCDCVGGAITIDEYRQILEQIGFINIEIEVEHQQSCCGDQALDAFIYAEKS